MRKEFAEQYFKIVSFLDPDHGYSIDYYYDKVRNPSRQQRYFVAENKTLDNRILQSHIKIEVDPRIFISDIVKRNVNGTHPELTLEEITILGNTVLDKDFKCVPLSDPSFMLNGDNFIGLCGGCVINVVHSKKDQYIDANLLIKKINIYMFVQRKCTAVVVPKDESSYEALKVVGEELNEKGKKNVLTEVFETKSFIYTL